MFNKSKVLVLSLAAMATLGLVGCGKVSSNASSTEPVVTSSSSSVDDDIDVSQNTSAIPETAVNIQLVGSVTSAGGTTVACWTPDGTGAVVNPHFTKESKMLYTLKNIDMAEGSEFKFTKDDNWSVNFAGSGIDQTKTDAATLAYFDLDKANNYSANIKVLTSGVFDFEYHPFYVAESGMTNFMVIKLHTA